METGFGREDDQKEPQGQEKTDTGKIRIMTESERKEYQDKKYKDEREDLINEKVKQYIEAHPNAPENVIENIRKNVGNALDFGEQAQNVDKQINENYRKLYEEGIRNAKEKIELLEARMKLAEDDAERQALQSQIVELRNVVIDNEKEVKARRKYNK